MQVLWQRVIRRLHVLKLAPVDWWRHPEVLSICRTGFLASWSLWALRAAGGSLRFYKHDLDKDGFWSKVEFTASCSAVASAAQLLETRPLPVQHGLRLHFRACLWACPGPGFGSGCVCGHLWRHCLEGRLWNRITSSAGRTGEGGAKACGIVTTPYSQAARSKSHWHNRPRPAPS